MYELTATQLVAKLWHEGRVRNFRNIARLTRHQIADVLCCERDKDGAVVLPEPAVRRAAGDDPTPQLCDYRSICLHVFRTRLEREGFPPEQIDAEVQRQWLATPTGRAQQQFEAAQAAAEQTFRTGGINGDQRPIGS